MHRATTGSELKYYYINIINIQHWISIKSIIIMNIYHLQALKMMTVNALMNGEKNMFSIQSLVTNLLKEDTTFGS